MSAHICDWPGVTHGLMGHDWLGEGNSSPPASLRFSCVSSKTNAPAAFPALVLKKLHCYDLVTKIFAGLMSRCTVPFVCAASSASAICVPISSNESDGEQLCRDAMLQGSAFQKFHREKRMAAGFVNLVNGADVGMVERRSGARFSLEPFQRLAIAREIVGQKLQRDEPAKLDVFGLIHHAHSAPPTFSRMR